MFTVVNRLHATAMALRAGVVVVRYQGQTVFLERNCAIGVQQIRLVLIDQILYAIEILKLPGIGRIAAHRLGVLRKVRRHPLVAVIEIRIGGVDAVVWHSRVRSGFIASMRGRKPVEAIRKMLTNTEPQAAFARGIAPYANDILPWTG